MIPAKLYSFSSSSSFRRCRLFGNSFLLRLSSITTAAVNNIEGNPSSSSSSSDPRKSHLDVVEAYLVKSCGFSSEEATKTLKAFSGRRSIYNPEIFVGLMRNHGFSDAQIKKIVSCNPSCLSLDPDNNLAPKFKSFLDLGFSGSDLIYLIHSQPRVLNLNFQRTLLPRIKTWQDLLSGGGGGAKDYISKIFKRGIHFLANNIDKSMPNLCLLRDHCGVSNESIGMMLRVNPRLILQRNASLVATVNRVEELGIPRSSGMFPRALLTLCGIRKATFEAKRKLMRSFGWSEADFLSAFRKAPTFVGFSTKTLSVKMDFLVKEVGYKPAEVAFSPILLMFSLEGRMIPRHRVVEVLKSKGLLRRQLELTSILNPSGKVFIDRYVTPYKDKVPELQDIIMHMAGSAGSKAALQ